jgi:hypothetical protein
MLGVWLLLVLRGERYKSEPLACSVSGFSSFCVANVFVLVILLSGSCCLHSFVIYSYMRNFESRVRIGGRCGNWGALSGAENLVLHMLQFLYFSCL